MANDHCSVMVNDSCLAMLNDSCSAVMDKQPPHGYTSQLIYLGGHHFVGSAVEPDE